MKIVKELTKLPEWMDEVFEFVNSRNHNRLNGVSIHVATTDQEYSKGVAWINGKKHINLWIGSNLAKALIVFIHELCHILRPKREGHTVKFWIKVWEMYHDYGVDLEMAKYYEFKYKKRAMDGYIRFIKSRKVAGKPCHVNFKDICRFPLSCDKCPILKYEVKRWT